MAQKLNKKPIPPFVRLPLEVIANLMPQCEIRLEHGVDAVDIQIPDRLPMNTIGFGRGYLKCVNPNFPGTRLVEYKASRVLAVCKASLALHYQESSQP